jgi:hypothetical protein
MIAIKINGVVYENVGTIKPSVSYEYHYDVVTMDGRRHRDIKGKRTNYEVTFFNNDFAAYDALKTLLMTSDSVLLEVPDSNTGTNTGEYTVTVTGDDIKGVLYDGSYYSTALSVTFERVTCDE